jgi:hypothetical protein
MGAKTWMLVYADANVRQSIATVLQCQSPPFPIGLSSGRH